MVDVDFILNLTGVVLLLLMLAVIVRAIIGPTMIDRVVAVNMIGTKTTALLLIIGTIFGSVEMFVDLAITYSLLNFLASLAAARFLRHLHKLPVDEEGRLQVEEQL